MNYREYLMDKILKNTTSLMPLDRFMGEGTLDTKIRSYNEDLRIDFSTFDIDSMEEWLDERNVDYDVWTLYFDDPKEIRDYILDEYDEHDVLYAWNEYIWANSYSDEVCLMDDFDNVVEDEAPSTIISELDDDFNINDEYFMRNDNGWLVSSDSIYELIDVDDLADYIFQSEDVFDLGGLSVDGQR